MHEYYGACNRGRKLTVSLHVNHVVVTEHIRNQSAHIRAIKQLRAHLHTRVCNNLIDFCSRTIISTTLIIVAQKLESIMTPSN